ncbi:GGDEF domain-containing protein [Alteromonas sp. ASW11-19]|uniref:diguanylate cyclase n=1 Tax=Alteromonas salexigens TaxID=2982530 RepID=A0ABT2VU11_9ALTE|nr:GGDEF domain-containing protein [Alteromonas salexigens]MCU7555344.1 GGDEF domain-containing protein [Alteromonas salexigens]
MSLSVPIGIVMALAVNVLVCIYFAAIAKAQPTHRAYAWWAVSCGLFSAGLVATVTAASSGGLQFLNATGCLLLLLSTYGLFCGLYHFELTRTSARLYQKAQSLVYLALVAITAASLFGPVVNVVTSFAMASMLLITEGCFYHRKSPFQSAYAALRAVLVVHAFILFLQGTVLLVKMLAGNDIDIATLFDLTLLTHLLLTLVTALVLPILHMLRKQHQWQKLASRDDLTTVNTRGAFLQKAYASVADNNIAQHSLLMVDIDLFKNINDTYGHSCGDEVLRQVARTLKAGIRNTDIIGRMGGEEFAILMPGLPMDKAHIIADRLRGAVAEADIMFNGERVTTTVSIGIAESTDVLDSWDSLFEDADKALYSAKRRGRNLVFLFGDRFSSPPVSSL